MSHMRGKATEKDLYPFLRHDLEYQREEFAEEIEERERRRFENMARAEAAKQRIKDQVEAQKQAKVNQRKETQDGNRG